MSDEIQIVDEQDNLIGHKERTLVDYKKDIYRSSCIWLENSKGQVLLAQRKWTKDKDPGMWGPAASGTIDKGETYDSNAYKELEEELGVSDIELKPMKKIWEHAVRQHFIQTYIGYTDKSLDEFTIQEDEVEQIAWLDKNKLIQDFKTNPEKYIPGMPRLLEVFGT